MRLIDKLYRMINKQWNLRRGLNASPEELRFLVRLLEIIENEDDGNKSEENE